MSGAGWRSPGVRALSLALVAAGLLSAATADLWQHRRAEEGTAARALLHDGRRVVVREIREPDGSHTQELQLRDRALEVIWRARLDGQDVRRLQLSPELVLVVDRETLVARELATGTVRWAQPMGRWSSMSLTVRGADLVEILDDHQASRTTVRRRALATGELLWTSEPIARSDHATRSWSADHLVLWGGGRAARVDLSSGAIELLVPEGATEVCVTTNASTYLDARARLWWHPFGGDAIELGTLAPGPLDCALLEGRTYVHWTDDELPWREEDPGAPQIAMMEGVHVEPGTDGAAFVLDARGAFLWGLAGRRGMPRFWTDAPRLQRPAPGRLTLPVTAFLHDGEDGGFAYTRSTLVVEEATGRVISETAHL